MALIRGGFSLSDKDEALLNRQKVITKKINERFIQVGAVYLKPASKHPIDEDWFSKLQGDVDLQSWIDSPNHAVLNLGFNLQLGWMDIDIDAEDSVFNRFIISALRHLGVETRFAFGRQSVGVPTHVLVQIPEDESANFEQLSKFEPKVFRLGKAHYHVQLRSFPTNTTDKNVVRSAKQTVMPGSVYSAKFAGSEYDLSVWYGDKGPASTLEEVAETTPRRSLFTSVVRAVAFGTVAYLLRDHWVEGSRQTVAHKLTGWLARVVRDSQSLNAHESISNEVFCPIDADSIAESLISFICHEFNDDEAHMRKRAFHDAIGKLERNPDAKIPGWQSMQTLLGSEAVQALRNVVTPGNDVSELSKLVERYVYDETDNRYIDRERHFIYNHYTHEGAELERRHKAETIFIKGKAREAFRVFESSTLRKRVGFRDLYPDLTPGEIFRIGVTGNVIPDDEEGPAQVVFNTWKGWPIPPVVDPDPAKMIKYVAMLDKLLGLLTRNNAEQIKWIKDWISWTLKYPGSKQQIAWVCIGGMGTGKSFFGNIFMKAIMTEKLWGTASGGIVDQKFNIAPFKDKMFVFIDEARFGSESGTDEIKKMIRNVDVSGMEKYEDARNYRIFARIMFASNQPNMRISSRDVRDRALFYTRAWDHQSLGMSEMEFRTWAEGLKPFFDEFNEALQNKESPAYYLRHFLDMEPSKHEIESIKHSSSSDPDIAEANMSWSRRVAKSILESGYVAADDLAWEVPFDRARAAERVKQECERVGVPRLNPAEIIQEFMDAGIWVRYSSGPHRGMRSAMRWGDALDAYAATTGVVMDPYREPQPEDRGPNEEPFGSRKPRLGIKPALSGKF